MFLKKSKGLVRANRVNRATVAAAVRAVIEPLESRELFTATLTDTTSPTPSAAPLVSAAATTPIGFGKSNLTGTSSVGPTSLQFGPDGRLYVAQQDGVIKAYTIARTGTNAYAVTATENIKTVQSIVNHDDNGNINNSVTTRLVTGILVVGSASSPIIYVTSSDPRIGGGPDNTVTNADTNSGVISRLTRSGSTWSRQDLVRGLPRSIVDHATNGMQLDATTNTLFVAQAGNTNEGAPSNNFGLLPEYAYSAAILSVNLNAIGSTTYDLPTLDDESRPGTADQNDPFGGNRGKNQAILVAGGPVQIYQPGYRNPYDLVLTQSGRMYAVDNGANAGWGDVPIGTGGTATNAIHEPGAGSPDNLQLITQGVYAGHPNPTRANKSNTFNTTNPQSPITTADPQQGTFIMPGQGDGALTTFTASTNGITEYTASNFGGAMKGSLLITSYSGQLFQITLDATGTNVVSKVALFSNIGTAPLDVTTQGDTGAFAGTIWVVDHLSNAIIAFEPNDFGGGAGGGGTGADDPTLDDDHDGYNNHDEIVNGTSPLSGADVPHDWDTDFVSDLLDADDDNDGRSDTSDPFAIDPNNGKTTNLPLQLSFGKEGVSPGGLLGLGFTGLMTNGTSNYSSLYDPTKLTAGGAASVLTVDAVSSGDALGNLNNQQNGFQVGLNVSPSTATFTAQTRILAPFAGVTPVAGQSIGFYIGTGDQDNYAKLVVTGSNGGGVQFLKEVNGAPSTGATTAFTLAGVDSIDLFLTVNPATSTIQASYSVTINGIAGPIQTLGTLQSIPAAWLTNSTSGLAVGLMSTAGNGASFPATWGFLYVTPTAAESPFGGTAPTVPGRVEAENFNEGGEGVAYHDADASNNGNAPSYRATGVDLDASGDAGGGYNISWVKAGEWLDYTVNVPTSGTFDFDLRVANKGAGGGYHLEENGRSLTGAIAVPDTGDWQTYTTLTVRGITLAAGVHNLRLVADSQNASGFAGNVNWFQFRAAATNQAPVVNAGADQTISLPNTSALVGSATDDGLPTSSLTTTWTKVSGTGTVTFANASALSTSASFSAAGTYVLRLTASDGSLSSTDDLTIVVNPQPAGGTVTLGSTGDAYVYDGAKTQNFGAASQLIVRKTSGTGNREGLIKFDLSAITGTITSVKFRIYGALQTSQATNVKTDIYKTTTTWAETGVTWNNRPASSTKLGTITVANVTAKYYELDLTSFIKTELAAGRKVVGLLLRNPSTATPYTYFNSRENSANAPQMVVTTSGPSNQAPVVNAGADQTITLPNTAALSATATDDGLPSGTLATTWTKVSGPGTVTFANATAKATTASFSIAGSYVLRLTANDGSLSTSDDIAITVNAAASAQTPFSGTPVAMPGRIEAENYDKGGEGIAFHDIDNTNMGGALRTDGVDVEATSDTGGGYNLGWTRAGEWLEYTVNVPAAGNFNLDVRVASGNPGGAFHVEVDGVNKTGSMTLPFTGSDWVTWSTVSKTGISMTAGSHVLRLAFDASTGGGDIGNVNWMQFTAVAPAAAPLTQTLAAAGDTLIRDGEATTNMGALATLQVKKSSTAGNNRESLLKFDLGTGAAPVISAKVRLFGNIDDTRATNLLVSLFGVDANWQELGVTWTTKPALGTKLSSQTVTDTTARWYEFDVTAYVNAELAAGRSVVAFDLQGQTASSPGITFASREAAANGPELLVTR